MRPSRPHIQLIIRLVAGCMLAGLLVFYTWFALRQDGLLKTVPGVPHAVWYYFDHHADMRNGCAFFLLGSVVAACVVGVRWQWQVLAVVLSLLAPLAKEIAQGVMTETRHANLNFAMSGTMFVILGWVMSKVVLLSCGRVIAHGWLLLHLRRSITGPTRR